MKSYGVVVYGIGLSLILQVCSTLSAKTLQQMQDLYKNIGNDLMSIRKDFAAAQPKVYSILDRIDKMYNLAKITAEKKHNLSVTLKNQSGETNRLYAEINTLKSKIAANEEELLNTRKKLENVNDALEKARASQLSQERTQVPTQESDMHKVKTTPNLDKKQPDSKDLLHEIRNLKGLSEEEKNLLKQAQSLSLSSTSAPSSPR